MKFSSVFIIVIILVGCYSKEPEKTGFEGKVMPSIKLLLIDSITNIDTKDIPIGNPVVLFYFGPHCPYSRAQLKEIVDEMSTLKNINFYIFSAFQFNKTKEIFEQFHLDKYPNITTGFDYNKSFSNYYKVTGVPYLAIYDKNKKLIEAFEGKVFTKQIKQALED